MFFKLSIKFDYFNKHTLTLKYLTKVMVTQEKKMKLDVTYITNTDVRCQIAFIERQLWYMERGIISFILPKYSVLSK